MRERKKTPLLLPVSSLGKKNNECFLDLAFFITDIQGSVISIVLVNSASAQFMKLIIFLSDALSLLTKYHSVYDE